MSMIINDFDVVLLALHIRPSSTAERKKAKKKSEVAFRLAFGELAVLRSFLPEGKIDGS